MITRWLGDFGLEQGVASATMRVHSAGRLVLCSDGLWAHVSIADLEKLHRAYTAESPAVPALGLAQALTAKAIAGGGTDNITVVVVDVDRPDPGPEHHSAEASE
jgi:serine/threonine protein phosphatase PrpC